jgi:hypothetical protein
MRSAGQPAAGDNVSKARLVNSFFRVSHDFHETDLMLKSEFISVLLVPTSAPAARAPAAAESAAAATGRSPELDDHRAAAPATPVERASCLRTMNVR